MSKCNKYEQEIIDILSETKADIGRIDYLLKHGANVNQQDTEEIEEGHYFDSLFQTIISSFHSIYNNPNNLYEVLKCFIDNGLDIEKYGSSIMSDFHYIIGANQDFYAMIKLILNSINEKLDVTVSINGLGGEESWLTSTNPLDYYENPAKYANKLDGLLKILENYESGLNYNEIYDCYDAIGEVFLDIYLFGNYEVKNNYRIEFNDLYGRNSQLFSMIKFNKDNLIIEDYYWVYINNSETNINDKNEFTKNVSNILKWEKLLDIEFKHSVNSKGYIRVCTLFFSNGKKLEYGYDESVDKGYLELKR